jgi:F-type H+-transporting ATPase subunit gamma
MSDTLGGARHKLTAARKLGSVVRAMKAAAATSIAQYAAAVDALEAYARSVELGLSLCLREASATPAMALRPGASGKPEVGALIFGSDQGLVGRFNEAVAEFALRTLQSLPGAKTVWVVGERVCPCIEAATLSVRRRYSVPGSAAAITSLVSEIQLEIEEYTARTPAAEIHVFHNRPLAAPQYESTTERLLPLDDAWRKRLARIAWPAARSAEVLGGAASSFAALLHEHLFICVYKACAESLASENTSRLEAMQRAEKNIDEISANLHRSLNRLRQSSIDQELFDIVSGFNSLGDNP